VHVVPIADLVCLVEHLLDKQGLLGLFLRFDHACHGMLIEVQYVVDNKCSSLSHPRKFSKGWNSDITLVSSQADEGIESVESLVNIGRVRVDRHAASRSNNERALDQTPSELGD
jgi:hypothetical protein